jgi:hypothetical protein
MAPSPTPIERLLQLERDIEQLRRLHLVETPSDASIEPNFDRPVWPSDELLLTRLLRRSPIALSAYQAPAELTASEQRGLRLTVASAPSPFFFCQLQSGDAALWLTPNPPEWIWSSPLFVQLFGCPVPKVDGQDLMLQSLALFKPIERHRQWTLFRQGSMLPQPTPFFEQAEQTHQSRKLEMLERRVNQLVATNTAETNELRHQLSVMQSLLDRLYKLLAPRAH